MPLRFGQLTVGLYGKQLAFWLVLTIILSGGIFTGSRLGHEQLTQADLNLGFDSLGQTAKQVLTITETGQIKLDNRSITAQITPLPQAYELRYKLLDEPGFGLDRHLLEIRLPKPIDPTKLELRPLLIHSAFSPNPQLTQVSNQIYQVEATDLDPSAIYTIVLKMPKDYLRIPWWRLFIAQVGSSLAIWITLAILLPIISAIFMFVSIWRVRQALILPKSHRLKTPVLDRPPRRLSPAVVGLLTRGRITERDIAATLIDLAWRGFIEVYSSEEKFSLIKRLKVNRALADELKFVGQKISPLARLAPFERALLSKIFYPKQAISRESDILFRVGHRLFSQKIAQVYISIYESAYKQGFFTDNPSVIHRWYISRGLIIFFVGLVGYAFDALAAGGPTLLFWVGTLAAGLVITQLGGLISPLSKNGLAERAEWLAFKKYLADPAPIRYDATNSRRFEQFLPYAIVLGVEKEWLARFENSAFVQPEWFSALDHELTLDDFARRLFELIATTSKLLVAAKDPSVQ